MRAKKAYPKVQSGEWVTPVQGYRMACCDCGLVHELYFRTRSGHLQFSATRNNRATAAKRRAR